MQHRLRPDHVGPLVAAVVSGALLAAACDSTVGSGPEADAQRRAVSMSLAAPDGGYAVSIDPGDFVAEIDNPYFPLRPGTVFRLRGQTEDGLEMETIRVTPRTREILGVRTTVVTDVVRVDGEITEVTEDWYAQDLEGNVWYFGEETAEYEDGHVVTTEGSWEAGVDGALPGIIMVAEPRVSDAHRQEYYPGKAEDMFWVVGSGGRHTVPFGTFRDVLRVLEWSPLEPRVVVEKVYARGTGLIAERSLSGDTEMVELLDISSG